MTASSSMQETKLTDDRHPCDISGCVRHSTHLPEQVPVDPSGLEQVLDLLETGVPAAIECLPSTAMLSGPAGADGAVGAGHVATGVQVKPARHGPHLVRVGHKTCWHFVSLPKWNGYLLITG
jgi:hypothetical protein